MAHYHYKGRDSDGESVEGVFEANIVADVVRHLNRKGITPIDIELLKKRYAFAFLYSLKGHLGLTKVNLQELIVFTRQMSTLIGAGVPIINSLKQIAMTVHSKTLSRALQGIVLDIVAGQSFSKSLDDYRNIFSPLFISIIEIGENTGHLQQAFAQLTTYLENQMLNRRRLMTAMRYPISVVLAVVGALIVMEIFVIPKFVDIFSRFKVALPWPTRVLMFTSEWFLQYWPQFLIGVVIMFFVFRYLVTLPYVRYVWDRIKLRFPVLGSLQKRIFLAQFSWALSVILQSGIPIIRGIVLASTSLTNYYLRSQVIGMEKDVKRGESFTQAAKNSKFFPAQALQIIAVGEEAGSLDNMMIEIAKYYDSEVDYDMRRINELLQPILLLVVGAMVLLLVLGIYLPMWDLVSVVGM